MHAWNSSFKRGSTLIIDIYYFNVEDWNPAQILEPCPDSETLFWITFVFLDRNLVLSNGWPQVNIVAAAVEREMRSPVRDTPQECEIGGNR